MPGKLIPGEEKTPVYKKSGPFTLRSGNKSPLAYKLMGSSPAKHDVTDNKGELQGHTHTKDKDGNVRIIYHKGGVSYPGFGEGGPPITEDGDDDE